MRNWSFFLSFISVNWIFLAFKDFTLVSRDLSWTYFDDQTCWTNHSCPKRPQRPSSDFGQMKVSPQCFCAWNLIFIKVKIKSVLVSAHFLYSSCDLCAAAGVVFVALLSASLLDTIALIYVGSSRMFPLLKRRVLWCLLASVDLRGTPAMNPSTSEFAIKGGVN